MLLPADFCSCCVDLFLTLFLSNDGFRPSTLLNGRFGFEGHQPLFSEVAVDVYGNLGRSDFLGTCPVMKIFRDHGRHGDVMRKNRL